MMNFNQYPYLNLTDLNLDFIIKIIGELKVEVNDFVSINAIKYADPIQWDITRQYEKNTIVIDPVTGTAYISVASVPSGVILTRTEYWSVVFDLEQFVTKANSNFTPRVEEQTTLTATFPTNEGELVVWNGELYTALGDIIAGDQYFINSNIRRTTIEDIIGDLTDLNTTVKSNIVNAINEVNSGLTDEITNRIDSDGVLDDKIDIEIQNRIDGDNALGIRIDDEITARENADTALSNALGVRIDDEITARENADTALGNTIIAKIGNLDNLPTTIKTNIVASINELYSDIHAIPTTTSYTTPENHGAVGDGVADDTRAINAAFESENIVVFKNGATYLVSDSITLPDNARLIGNGATIKLKSGRIIRYNEANETPVGVITIKDVSNVSVESLVIDVNGATMGTYNDYDNVDNVALAVETARDVTIKGCKFINLYTEGIDTHLTSGNVTIENNYFKHVEQFQGLRKDCIYIVSHSSGVINVNNNICDEDVISNEYGCGGIFFANVRNAVCGNNIVLNCGRRNAHGHPVAAICVYSECLNIDVHDNYIKSLEGIFRADASAKITFRDNYAQFTGEGGYSDSDYIRMTYYDPSYLGYWGEYTIANNTIIISDSNRGAARGIGLGHNNSRPLRSLRIVNNNIVIYNDAIVIYAKMNDVYIENNRIQTSSSGGHPDIRITDGGDNIKIFNNTCNTIRMERDAGSSQVCWHAEVAGNSCGSGGAAIKVDNTVISNIHDNCMNGRFEAGTGLYSVLVHDNNAHDSGSGYGYYGSVTGQHNNYYNNALVNNFQ